MGTRSLFAVNLQPLGGNHKGVSSCCRLQALSRPLALLSIVGLAKYSLVLVSALHSEIAVPFLLGGDLHGNPGVKQ